LAKVRAKQRRNAERDLTVVDRKIAGVIAMGEKGGDSRALALRLNELEAERRALLAQMPPGRESDAIALHPNAAERYKQKVADVHAALKKGDSASREAIALVRGLIERITITPTPRDKPPKLELIGNLAALMRESSENTVTVPIVAGACITRYRIYGGPPIQPMIKEYAGAALAAAAVSVAMAASAWADVKDYEFQLVRR
jgi:hypothetical protein